MRWEARGVAARLCSVARPAADRHRRLLRQAAGSAGRPDRRKQPSSGAEPARDGAETRAASQASSGSAGFLPDLVPCAGRRGRRSSSARTGSDRTTTSATDGSTGGTPGGAASGSRARPRLRSPALLPEAGEERPAAASTVRRRPPAVPPKGSLSDISTTQPAPKSEHDTGSERDRSQLRIVRIKDLTISDSSSKLRPPLPLSGSESAYVEMKMRPKKPEYANIDSCSSSCADCDSSASSGELLHPVADLRTMLSNLRLRSDRSSRAPPVTSPQRGRHRSSRVSQRSGVKGAGSLKESSALSRRRGSERSCSPPDCAVDGSPLSAERVRGGDRRHRSRLPSPEEFGYDIDNVSSFLSQATARTPANIPMVVTSHTELYVPGAGVAEGEERPTVPLQLGLVVNGLFKRRQWLYVQTPHRQEGYVAYSTCSALGVLPRRAVADSPWEPLPASGRGRSWSPPHRPAAAPDPRVNKTDTEKLYENVTSDGRALGLLVQQHVRQQRGQQRARRAASTAPHTPQTERPARHASSAFRRLQAAEVAPSRGRLVAPPSGRLVAPRTNNKAVIWDGFVSFGRNTLTVRRGDIVILLNTSVGDWFWVKDADGREGYIPAICVGSGLT